MFRKALVIILLLLFIGTYTYTASDTSYNNYIVDNEGDGDFITIQEAIDNASTGDFIWVYSGNYSGDININKTLNIIGVDQEYLNGTDTGNPHIWGAGAYIYNTSGVFFSNFSLGGIPDIDKIKLEYSDDCFILNCSADYLLLYNCSGVTVDNCEFTTNFDYFAGINLILSSNNIITNNICVSNAANTKDNIGICLQASDYNQLLNNTCTAKDSINKWGIDQAMHISTSNNNTISGNICFQSDIGIKLEASNNNTISLNNITMNKNRGMYLFVSDNNEITKNNFINNSKQAFFRKCKGTTWDENYWDDSKLPIPKLIFGTTGPAIGLIPWINLDLHPAKEPYNI